MLSGKISKSSQKFPRVMKQTDENVRQKKVNDSFVNNKTHPNVNKNLSRLGRENFLPSTF